MDPTPLTDASLADRIWMVVAGIPLGMCFGGVLAVWVYRRADLASRRRALGQLSPGDVPLSLAATNDLVEELARRTDNLVIAWQDKARKSRTAWSYCRLGTTVWIAGVLYVLARDSARHSLAEDPDQPVDPDAHQSDSLDAFNEDSPDA